MRFLGEPGGGDGPLRPVSRPAEVILSIRPQAHRTVSRQGGAGRRRGSGVVKRGEPIIQLSREMPLIPDAKPRHGDFSPANIHARDHISSSREAFCIVTTPGQDVEGPDPYGGDASSIRHPENEGNPDAHAGKGTGTFGRDEELDLLPALPGFLEQGEHDGKQRLGVGATRPELSREHPTARET